MSLQIILCFVFGRGVLMSDGSAGEGCGCTSIARSVGFAIRPLSSIWICSTSKANLADAVFSGKSGCVSEIVYFCSIKADTMSNKDLLNQIEQLGREIIPADGHLYLYGSRARGDFRPDSDWDLLILLNKEKEDYSDFDNYSYPFISLGYDAGVPISAHLFTMSKWDKMSFSPFYHNVEHDKIVLI